MTMPRLLAIQAYHRDCPPLHVLVKTFVGYEPKQEAADGALAPSLLDEIPRAEVPFKPV